MTHLTALHTLQAENLDLRAQLAAALAAIPKAKPAKAKAAAGGHWSDHLGAAREAAAREHGPHFWMVPNVAPWCQLTAAAARWKSPKGVIVKWTRAVRLPAERYWTPDTFPAVDTIAVDPPAVNAAKALAAIRRRPALIAVSDATNALRMTLNRKSSPYCRPHNDDIRHDVRRARYAKAQLATLDAALVA